MVCAVFGFSFVMFPSVIELLLVSYLGRVMTAKSGS